MRFSSTVVLYATTLFALSASGLAFADKPKEEGADPRKLKALEFLEDKTRLGSEKEERTDFSILKDDEAYWSRLLQSDVASLETAAPTPAPTGVCIVEVEIDCVSSSDEITPCGEIEYPGQCSEGDPLTSVTFTYTAVSCDDSRNTQDGNSQDVNNGPDDSLEASIVCVDMQDQTTILLDQQGVSVGDEITVTGANGGDLPESISCAISNNLQVVQLIEINTSGNEDLYLKDTFCSLQVESCIDDVGDTTDCFEEVIYTYDITNVGSDDMTITEVIRTRDGETTDLIGQVPTTDLAPNDFTTVTETETIDFCDEDCYVTTVSAEADPPAGAPCVDEDEFEFCTTVECRVDVDVTCVNEAGIDCEEVPVPPAGSPECLQDVTYTYTMTNVGTNDMTITEVIRTRDGDIDDLIGQVTNTELAPGDFTTVTETEEVDFCIAACYSTTIEAEADSPDGEACTGEDEFGFCTAGATFAPTPVPTEPPDERTCDVELELGCVPTNTTTPGGDVEFIGEDCNQNLPLLTRCDFRPFYLAFLYNGGDCEQSFNIQPDTLFRCTDFQGGPPTDLGTQSYLKITDIKGLGIVYYDGLVAVGDEFPVEDSRNPNPFNDLPFEVEANMNVSIYTADGPTEDNLLQTMVYHSSCSRNLFLKDRFGSIQLVVFENDEQGLISCFFNITFTFTITNEGTIDAELLSLTAIATPGGFVNLTDEVLALPNLGEDGSYLLTENVTIDLTVQREYTILSTLVGRTIGGSGEECSDSATLAFTAGNPTEVP